jgi:DNA replication initiation complex subunit (GINS family)
MLNYNDIYELLRKEKFAETLQALPKGFMQDFAGFLNERKNQPESTDLFSESAGKTKKQFENGIALFKELMLRRKKKLLNLVFVAAETGVMKRDYENMLPFEKEIFEKIVKAFEEGDKALAKGLQGDILSETTDSLKMILFNQDVEQFVDMSGSLVGPFTTGQMANLDAGVSSILVSSGKATFVDSE